MSEDTGTTSPGRTAGQEHEPIFGRCPSCGFIVEDAFDYDSQGNEVFRCERPTCSLVFAQDKAGAYVVLVNGLPLA